MVVGRNLVTGKKHLVRRGGNHISAKRDRTLRRPPACRLSTVKSNEVRGSNSCSRDTARPGVSRKNNLDFSHEVPGVTGRGERRGGTPPRAFASLTSNGMVEDGSSSRSAHGAHSSQSTPIAERQPFQPRCKDSPVSHTTAELRRPPEDASHPQARRESIPCRVSTPVRLALQPSATTDSASTHA